MNCHPAKKKVFFKFIFYPIKINGMLSSHSYEEMLTMKTMSRPSDKSHIQNENWQKNEGNTIGHILNSPLK
jgi:hypothetical protein